MVINGINGHTAVEFIGIVSSLRTKIVNFVVILMFVFQQPVKEYDFNYHRFTVDNSLL